MNDTMNNKKRRPLSFSSHTLSTLRVRTGIRAGELSEGTTTEETEKGKSGDTRIFTIWPT